MIDNISALIGKSLEDTQAQLESECQLRPFKTNKYLYIKANVDSSTFECYINKDQNNISNIELYDFFRWRELYSFQLTSNKGILTGGNTKMKLSSINIFSYITKIQTINNMSKKLKISIKECLVMIINQYLTNLNTGFADLYKEMLKELKLSEFELKDMLNSNFQKEISWIKNEKRKKLINNIQTFLLNNLDNIIAIVKDFKDGEDITEIRMYLDYPLEQYKKEFTLYLKSKAFNKNKYNVLYNHLLYGIPNNNFTLNSDKPYLQNQNKKENKVPYFVTLNQSIHNYYLFKYFTIMKDKTIKYNANSNLLIEYKNDNGNALITQYDNIPFTQNNNLIDFHITNIMHIKNKDKTLKKYSNVTVLNNSKDRQVDDLEWQFNCKLFNGKMSKSYNTNNDLKIEQGKFTTNMKAILYRHRQPLWNYFKYENKFSFTQMRKIVSKLMMELFELEDTKKEPLYFKILEGINFGISFIDFYENNQNGGIVMKLKELSETMKRKINDKDNINEIESDDEYYYCLGKLIKFLLSKSQTANKTYARAKPFFKMKSNKQIKTKVNRLMEKYCNTISFGNYRVENVFKMINSYEIDDKVSNDSQTILMIAIMDNMNEIYLKKDN